MSTELFGREGTIRGTVTPGKMIVNDYLFEIEETSNSYIFTATRGTEEQSLTLPKGEEGGGVYFTTDETLTLDPKTNVLSVNTASEAQADNTLPITSAAVATQIGNIEILLKTI